MALAWLPIGQMLIAHTIFLFHYIYLRTMLCYATLRYLAI